MTSFKDLEKSYVKGDNHYSLDDWYYKIRSVPFEEFSSGDLAKSIRQNLFIKEILPIAIQMIIMDINSGEKYDGELLSSLLSVPRHIWLDFAQCREFREFISKKHGEILEMMPYDGANVYESLMRLLNEEQ